MSELDITDWKETDATEIIKKVTEAVNDTQRIIIQPYPDKVKMTRKQYQILKGVPPDAKFEFDLKLFETKYNVMDIVL